MNLEVYLDDELAYSQQQITKQKEAIRVDLDVKDVMVLKIVTSIDSYNSSGDLYITDDIIR